jgi:DNA-binding transcriptional regulator YdaS (Cro superfamily)
VNVVTDNFAHSLLKASHALGSLLDVAQLLGVEPKQVYFWIAEVQRPSAAQRRSLEEKLRSCIRG